MQRYAAPRSFDVLLDDLIAMEDALAAFPVLRAHGGLLWSVVLEGWHDSRRRFEAAGRDPQLLGTAVDADLDQKLEDVVASIIDRLRRPRSHQNWGATREVQRLAGAGDTTWSSRRDAPLPGVGRLAVSPEPIYQLQAQLRRDVRSAS